MSHLDTEIRGILYSDAVSIGRGVVIQEGAVIKGRSIAIGDFVFIGNHTKILVDEFNIGDYTKLHAFSFAHGDKPMRIGRNCWIGGGVILDSIGGLEIEDGVGIGSHSQLWTHMRFGDLVQGCRFNSAKPMRIRRDAWLVGHCLVSPVQIGERSMALMGSVITRDLMADRIYAGNPAADITDKIGGPQFIPLSRAGKEIRLRALIDEFERRHPEFAGQLDQCRFDVEKRTYRKTLGEAEVAFLKENTPLVKFVPEES